MVVSWHVEGPKSARFRGHLERVPDYLWLSADGMKMQGTNGSQLWDTSFAVQAMIEGGLANEPEFQETTRRIHGFLRDTQLQENVSDLKGSYRLLPFQHV